MAPKGQEILQEHFDSPAAGEEEEAGASPLSDRLEEMLSTKPQGMMAELSRSVRNPEQQQGQLEPIAKNLKETRHKCQKQRERPEKNEREPIVCEIMKQSSQYMAALSFLSQNLKCFVWLDRFRFAWVMLTKKCMLTFHSDKNQQLIKQKSKQTTAKMRKDNKGVKSACSTHIFVVSSLV